MEGGASKRVRALKEEAVLVDVTIGLKSELKSMDGAIVDSDGNLPSVRSGLLYAFLQRLVVE